MSCSFLLLLFGDVVQDALHGGLNGGQFALLSLQLLLDLSLHLLLGILDLGLHGIDFLLHAFDLFLDDGLLVLGLLLILGTTITVLFGFQVRSCPE